MDPYPSMIAVLSLIILNALITAGRTALTMLGDGAVKRMASSGNPKERLVARMLEKPAALLEGCKLAGFTCTVVASLLTWRLLPLVLPVRIGQLLHGSQPERVAGAGLVLLAILLAVMVLDVFCLLLPYRIACRYPQPVAFALAHFCRAAAFLFRPFAALNNAAARLLSYLVGIRGDEEPEQATEEEIRMMVDVGSEKGEIEQSEKDMINNIFEFDDRNVSEVMTHRTDMTAVPVFASLDEITKVAIESGYSRIPVYEDDIDDIIGILYVKDLLPLIGKHDHGFDARTYMRSVLFVPENMSCVDLFSQFRIKKVQVAIAVDEYGGTAGIVSMEDLVESIVGSIQDEYDHEEEMILKLGDGCYELDGAVSIDEVERLFDISLSEDSDYDTIGGLLTETLERIPLPEEHPSVELSGIQFTILLVEERRIARIRAERMIFSGV